MQNELKTLTDAIRYFADEQVCIDTVAAMRWPDGPQCPICFKGAPRQHWLKNQRRWQCRDCGKQYSVKVNTIFEDSAIKLDKWLTAMWLMANCKNGVSSYEIARSVGVTQKSAWFMLQRIRLAMQNESILRLGNTGGPVEMDETCIGGKQANMHMAKRKRIQNSELPRCVDELGFRFGNRATKDNPLTDKDRFALVLSRISGKELTNAEPTGKVVPATAA